MEIWFQQIFIGSLLKSHFNEHTYLQIHKTPWEQPAIRIPPGENSCKNKEQNGYNQNDIQQSCPRQPFNTKRMQLNATV